MMYAPVSFSDAQMREIKRHAKALPVEKREIFLQTIADNLTGEVSDAAVWIAINNSLDRLVAIHNSEKGIST